MELGVLSSWQDRVQAEAIYSQTPQLKARMIIIL